ncbi:MAG: hypothetical protein ACH34V_07080 [Flavobacterium sp.]|uniref:hypothetical protein n=1 Tax=Flavobacterium sp. TaxID=239 RepID=UPI003793F135
MALSRTKNVAFNNTPSTSKNVKIAKDPENYKNLNICWQFGLMDFEFQYGWHSIINRFEFTQPLKEELLLELAGIENSDNLYNAIDKIPTVHFNNFHDFFKRIDFIDNINSEHILCVTTKFKESYFWSELFPKLKDLESLKWHELEIQTYGKHGKSKHHWVSTNQIIKEAKERLIELKLDDYTEIFSIRLTGTNRIWGIRNYNYFQLLWFDFDHEICPSSKRYT